MAGETRLGVKSTWPLTTMSKLRLKETQLEREERILKEKRRAARKQRKKGVDLEIHESEDRLWQLQEPEIYRTPNDVGVSYDQSYLHSLGGDAEGPQRPPRPRLTENFHRIRAELDEANFRSKLFDAMDDDTRLEAMEARFNSYHVPERWRDKKLDQADDPTYMDDDTYAEWLQNGMRERQRKREEDERERRKRYMDDQHSRREKKKAIPEKTQSSEAKRFKDLFDKYNNAWDLLQSSPPATMKINDIPWPLSIQPKSPEDITSSSVSAFLLSRHHTDPKAHKYRIREALMLFHPDRFEKWILLMGTEQDAAQARELAGTVVRVLNSLAESGHSNQQRTE